MEIGKTVAAYDRQIAGQKASNKAKERADGVHIGQQGVETPEKNPEENNLLLEKKTFPVADSAEVKKEDFITQDEKDARLTGGSGFHNGNFRIYDYFMEGHDSRETAQFLKNEYGTGSQSHALAGSDQSWEDHDAKGIRLKKGSILEPYNDVLLSWEVMEKRIRRLIQEDKYLSPAAKAAYAEYKDNMK